MMFYRADEFAAGHCTDAVNIVWDSSECWKTGMTAPTCKDFVDKMTSLVDGVYTTGVFIHCVSGNRAGQAAKFLNGMNWTQTKSSASDFGVEYQSTYTDSSKFFTTASTTRTGVTWTSARVHRPRRTRPARTHWRTCSKFAAVDPPWSLLRLHRAPSS